LLAFSVRGGACIAAQEDGRVSQSRQAEVRAGVRSPRSLRIGPPSSTCAFRALEQAFLPARDRLGLRLIHFAGQGNHVHLIVEAKDSTALSSGMQGLTIHLGKALNRVMALGV
jgi:hypothetical protein